MVTPIKTPKNSPSADKINDAPQAPKKRGSMNGADVADAVARVKSNAKRKLDFGIEPKRVKLTFEGSVVLLRSRDMPNAAFKQYWGDE